MVSQLKKNDKVVTQAGIIGTVARIDDDEVFLKIDENSNVRLRVTKSSVARVLTSSSRPADDDKDKDKDEGTTDEDITARPRS
jgi:preprotein translocase subunit YajC